MLDSIFHFYKNDLKKETKLLMQIIESMEVGAILINCLLKNNSAEKHLKKIVNKFKIEILKDNLNYSYLFVRTSIYPVLIPFTTLIIVHPLGEVKKIQKEHTL